MVSEGAAMELRDAVYDAHLAGQRVHDLRLDTIAAMNYAQDVKRAALAGEASHAR